MPRARRHWGGICRLESRAAQSDPRLGETKTAVNAIVHTKTMGVVCPMSWHYGRRVPTKKEKKKKVRSGQCLLGNGEGSALPDQKRGEEDVAFAKPGGLN